MSLANEISSVVAEVVPIFIDFFPDLCDLIAPVQTTQGSGHTIIDSVVATNIVCLHEQISGGGVQFNENGSVVTKTDRIYMEVTAATQLIDRHYKIKIHANGLNPEQVFEQPVLTIDSFPGLAIVLAVVSEGYRRPGVA